LLDEIRAHDDALVRDTRGDHPHLKRRHEQPLLAEREPSGIDLRGRVGRVEELPVLVEAARRALVQRRLERRPRIEPEPFRVVEIRRMSPKFRSTRFSLYVGLDARASTLPVAVSIATAAPHLPARAWFASRWACGSIVR